MICRCQCCWVCSQALVRYWSAAGGSQSGAVYPGPPPQAPCQDCSPAFEGMMRALSSLNVCCKARASTISLPTSGKKEIILYRCQKQLCLQVTSKIVAERPLTMLIPTVPLLLYVSLGLFWVWSTIYLYTSCKANPPASPLAIARNVNLNLKEDYTAPRCSPESPSPLMCSIIGNEDGNAAAKRSCRC